ncbi:hypothetical protein MPSEU_000618300 [Mayamaea pseudoterrestris]|nr:hypothetical protein MPSEU_000618300 [Mayamaea pseudoterrestris]
MSATRMTLRKRHVAAALDKVNPSIFEEDEGGDLEMDAAVEEHEMSSVTSESEDDNAATKKKRARKKPAYKKPPATKRRRKSDAKKLAALDLDAIGLVMDFVGHRELLTLALSSKFLRSKLSMEMVVKSAFVSGDKKARSNIEAVNNALTDQNCYAPSPFRLLQLVNAKGCEVCNVSLHSNWRNLCQYGRFYCDGCRNGREAQEEEHTLEGFDAASLARFRLILQNHHSVSHKITERALDTPSENSIKLLTMFVQSNSIEGVRVGPIMAMERLEAIKEIVISDPDKPIKDVIGEVLIDDNAPYTLEQFKAALKVGEERGRAADTIRWELRRQVTLKAARNRLANLDTTLKKLKSKLLPEISDFVLDRTTDSELNVTFACPLVGELLRNKSFLRAPTRVSDDDLEMTANTLNAKFQAVIDCDFLSAEFLKPSHRLHATLKPIFLEQFPDLPSVALKLTGGIADDIENGDLAKAMFALAHFPFGQAEFGTRLMAGLTSKRVRDDRIDMDRLLGVHWVMWYIKYKHSPRSAYKAARKNINVTISLVASFLFWLNAKKRGSELAGDEDLEALYKPTCLRYICSGRFDVASASLGMREVAVSTVRERNVWL